MKVIVEFSDGTEKTIVGKDKFEVAAEILETVTGCDFATTPTRVVEVDDNSDPLTEWELTWNLSMEPQT